MMKNIDRIHKRLPHMYEVVVSCVTRRTIARLRTSGAKQPTMITLILFIILEQLIVILHEAEFIGW